MNVTAMLAKFIALVSSVLLLPVLLLLSVFTLWILFHAGMFVAEWRERRRSRPVRPEELPGLLRSGEGAERALPHNVRDYLAALRALLARPDQATEPVIEGLLQDRIAALSRPLDMLRMLVRIGPGLGLMGTLIPIGTGLAGLLGRGDLNQLSADLIVAFTTTVVGLTIGLSAYFFHTIRRRWMEQDIRLIELITELLANPPPARTEPDGPTRGQQPSV